MTCGRTCSTWAQELQPIVNAEWHNTEATKPVSLTVKDLEHPKDPADHKDPEPHRDPSVRPPNFLVNSLAVQTPDPASSPLETSTANANSRTRAPSAQPDLLVRPDSQDCQEFPERTEFPDRTPKTSRMPQPRDASTAPLDQLDHPVPPASPVSVVCADLRATQDSQDVTDSQAVPETKEPQVPLVRTDTQEPPVKRVTTRRNPSAARDHEDHPVRPDPKDLWEKPDRTDQKESPALQDRREPQASKDQLESTAMRVLKDQPESPERMPNTAHAPDAEVLVPAQARELVLVALLALVLAETTAGVESNRILRL